ncbi:MAG: hypothetical protein GY950_31630 [bacterium]|nr:hypothetical protein [bacterium]
MSVDLDEMVTDILDKQKEREGEVVKRQEVTEDYPALYTLSRFYRILAWVIAVVAGIGIIGFLGTIFIKGEILMGIAGILLTGVMFGLMILFTLSFSEGIKLFIQMELNTKKQTVLLSKLLEKK